jgi:hypothetical protein
VGAGSWGYQPLDPALHAIRQRHFAWVHTFPMLVNASRNMCIADFEGWTLGAIAEGFKGHWFQPQLISYRVFPFRFAARIVVHTTLSFYHCRYHQVSVEYPHRIS